MSHKSKLFQDPLPFRWALLKKRQLEQCATHVWQQSTLCQHTLWSSIQCRVSDKPLSCCSESVWPLQKCFPPEKGFHAMWTVVALTGQNSINLADPQHCVRTAVTVHGYGKNMFLVKWLTVTSKNIMITWSCIFFSCHFSLSYLCVIWSRSWPNEDIIKPYMTLQIS